MAGGVPSARITACQLPLHNNNNKVVLGSELLCRRRLHEEQSFEMTDSLAKYGLYIDDLWKIRLLEPEVANQSEKLRTECENFIGKISEFEKNTNRFIEILDDLGKEVDKEKMRTIGARNLLRSVAKQKEARKQQIQALIVEKTMELERLRVQQDSLRKIQQDQLETIEHLSVN